MSDTPSMCNKCGYLLSRCRCTPELSVANKRIAELECELAGARRVLTEIANEDYRGNRPASSWKAYHYLQSIHARPERGGKPTGQNDRKERANMSRTLIINKCSQCSYYEFGGCTKYQKPCHSIGIPSWCKLPDLERDLAEARNVIKQMTQSTSIRAVYVIAARYDNAARPERGEG